MPKAKSILLLSANISGQQTSLTFKKSQHAVTSSSGSITSDLILPETLRNLELANQEKTSTISENSTNSISPYFLTDEVTRAEIYWALHKVM